MFSYPAQTPPLLASPARGEVPFCAFDWIVPHTPACTSPLAGEAGWGDESPDFYGVPANSCGDRI